jgi:hypothetical protein
VHTQKGCFSNGLKTKIFYLLPNQRYDEWLGLVAASPEGLPPPEVALANNLPKG